MKPYSQDIRIRVLHAHLYEEESQRQVARRFNVSLTFVRDLLKRYRETGSISPRECHARPNSKIDKDSLQLILALVAADPFLPLSTLCERLAEQRSLRISRATMWRTLQKHRSNKATRSAGQHEPHNHSGSTQNANSVSTAPPAADNHR